MAHKSWQIFGGISYTWEHDFHLYLRRLTADASLYGSAGLAPGAGLAAGRSLNDLSPNGRWILIVSDAPDLGTYRRQAARWLSENLQPRDPDKPAHVRGGGHDAPEDYLPARALQKKIYEPATPASTGRRSTAAKA